MESLLLNNERGQYPTNIGNCDDGTSDDQEQGEGLTLRLKNVRPRSEDEKEGEDDFGNDKYDHGQTEEDRPVKRLRFLMSESNPAESMHEQGEGEVAIEGEGEEEGGEGNASTDKSTVNNSLRLVISREGSDSGGHRPQPTSSNHTMQKPQLRNSGTASSQPDQEPTNMRASRRGPAETAKTERSTGARTGSRTSTRASASKTDHELEEEEEEAVSYGAQDEDDDNDSDTDDADDDDKPVADDEDSQSEESDNSVPRSSRRRSKTKVLTPTRSSSRRQSAIKPATSASRRLSGRIKKSYAEADSDEESDDDEEGDRIDTQDKEDRSESDTELNDVINHTGARRSGRESAGRNKLYDVKLEQETAVILKRESRGRVIPPPPLPVQPTRSRMQINQDNGRLRRLPAARISTSSSSSSSSSSSAHPIAVPAIKPIQHYRIDSDTKANMYLILSTIETADKQNLFAESVTDEEAPGYSEIVLNPMDLGTAKYVITPHMLFVIAFTYSMQYNLNNFNTTCL